MVEQVERILVPMDGSPLSKKALKVALLDYPDADITALHVIDPTEPGYSYPVEYDTNTEPRHGSDAWYDRAHELADELFEEVTSVAADHGVSVATETVVAQTADAIIDYTEKNDVDLVVIGSHGREEEARFLLGSVSELVAFRAPCRVMLVR